MARLPEDNEPTTRVFLSYSRKDTVFAIWLRERLEKEGIEVYRDIDDTLPSEQWWARLQQLIGEADTVLFVLSGNSAASTVCAQEVSHAQSLNKRIFPAVIADVDWSEVPAGLAKVHGVYFRADGTQEVAATQLIAALMIDIGWVREHTRLLQRAQRWNGRGRRQAELLSGRALKEAERWLAAQPGTAEAPTNVHRAYIQSSRQRATRHQRSRYMVVIAGILAAAVAYGLVVSNQRIAERKSFQAQTLKSLRIVDQAQRLTRQGDTSTAMLLGLEVLPIDRDTRPSPFAPAARRSLFAAASKHKLLAVMRPDGAVPSKALLSPDGSHLFLQTQKSDVGPARVRLLAVRNGRLGKSVMPEILRGRLRDLLFSPDGRYWAVMLDDGTIRLWDAHGGREISLLDRQVERNDDSPIATFSNDGKCLVTRGLAIQVWDPATGKLRVALPPKYVEWRISGKGCRLAAKAADHKTVAVWDGLSGKQLAVFATDNQVSFSLNASGTLVATSDYAGVTLWDVKTSKQLRSFRAHQRRTYSVQFSPSDDDLILTEGDDGLSLWVNWDRYANTSIGRINGTAPMFTADGKLIVANVNSSQLEEWEFPFVYKYGFEPRRIALLPGSPGANSTVLVKHDVRQQNALLSLYDNGELRIWSLGQPLQRKRMDDGGLLVTMSGDHSRFITLDREGSAQSAALWDAGNLRRLSDHKLGDALAGSFDSFDRDGLQLGPAGKRLLTLSGKGNSRAVRVSDVVSGRIIARVSGSLGDMVSAVFAPDGRRIVTTTSAGQIAIWSAGSGAKVKSFESGVRGTFRAIVTQDQKGVVLAARDGQLYLIDLASGDVLRKMRLWPAKAGETAHDFEFAEAGGVATAVSGKYFKAFDLQSGKMIVALTADRFIYHRVAIGHGKIALTLSDDVLEVRIYDIAAGDWVGRLQIAPRGELGHLALMSGGRELLTAWQNPHGTASSLTLWRLLPTAKAMVKFARKAVPHCLSGEQRAQYELQPGVPDWCIAMRKQPYDTDAWRQRLAGKRGEGVGSKKARPPARSTMGQAGRSASATTLGGRPPMPAGRRPPDWRRQ